MRPSPWKVGIPITLLALGFVIAGLVHTKEAVKQPGDPPPPDDKNDFASVKSRMERAKPELTKNQLKLLSDRYDLADRAAKGTKMSNGKAIQAGPQTKLPKDMTWQKLAELGPEK